MKQFERHLIPVKTAVKKIFTWNPCCDSVSTKHRK